MNPPTFSLAHKCCCLIETVQSLFVILCYSLLDRRGFVVPDVSQSPHVSAMGIPVIEKEREGNSVHVRHEYYGSTTMTSQKVRSAVRDLTF